MRHNFKIDEVEKPMIDEQTAIIELKRMARSNRIKLSTVKSDNIKSDAADLVIDAIMEGQLSIDKNGQPTLTWEGCNDEGNFGPLTFYKFKGSALMAMDGKSEDERITQIYASLASWTKSSIVTFSVQMVQADVAICLALFNLFFVK